MAIRPQDVKSPREHWLLIDVLVEKTDWSVALGEWDGRRVLAMRWNGDDERPKGNPVSHGVPTWFVLPDEFTDLLLGSPIVPSGKAHFARTCLRRGGEEPAAGACRADLEALNAQITDENWHPEVGTGLAVAREFS